MRSNCVTHAFDGRNNNNTRIASDVWVGSGAAASKLWDALATQVYPAQGQPSFAQAKIHNNDVAGNDTHVWLLKNPEGGNGNAPARSCEWVNSTSGVYILTHNNQPHNCAPDAIWTPVLNGPDLIVNGNAVGGTFDDHTNEPYHDDDLIKRE